jgi:glycosyltransferase involved in cell wall biosynthesis
MDQKPMVSVVMITYNHEKYIAEAMNGVFMQKCDFDIEFIIANDKSTDETDRKILECLSEVSIPKNIKIEYANHEQNKGVLGNFIWALQQARGKYIAYCEGDDYWTDPLKLQKQVDFLEKNSEFELCFTNCKTVDSDNKTLNPKFLGTAKNSFTRQDLLFIAPTLTRVFKNRNFREINIKDLLAVDAYMLIWQLHKGKAWFINEVTASYRKHSGGIWSLANELSKAKYYFDIRLKAFEIIDESLVLKFNRLTIIALLKIKILSLKDYSVCRQKFLTNFKNQSRQTFTYKSRVYLSLLFLKFSNKKNKDFFKKLIKKIL